jgi:hypothetical protein
LLRGREEVEGSQLPQSFDLDGIGGGHAFSLFDTS